MATELAEQGNYNFGSKDQRLSIAGRDERAKIKLARIVMYQGTAEEVAQYGEGTFKRGEWVDQLANQSLGDKISVVFVPGLMTASYSIWEKGKRVPTAQWDNAKDVPPDLLESTTGPGGEWIPPQAQEAINCVVIVNGREWPYVVTFKKTSLKTFNNRIMPMEAQLASAGLPPGMYELSGVDDKNSAGQPYKRVISRYVGKPSKEMLDMAQRVFQGAESYKAAAKEAASEVSHTDGDD